jgi:hypothetical protein
LSQGVERGYNVTLGAKCAPKTQTGSLVANGFQEGAFTGLSVERLCDVLDVDMRDLGCSWRRICCISA